MDKQFQKELLLQFVDFWIKPSLQSYEEDDINNLCEYVGFERNAFDRF